MVYRALLPALLALAGCSMPEAAARRESAASVPNAAASAAPAATGGNAAPVAQPQPQPEPQPQPTSTTPPPEQPSPVLAPAAADNLLDRAAQLKPGAFVWEPERSATGNRVLVISLPLQRLALFRGGVAIAVSTVSTGRPGYRTPAGRFTILERDEEHYSSIYNNAPMPYMQRLTWGGVALHAGNLPGYPASHGCIRLPHEFARLLFGVTRLGDPVVVTAEAMLRLPPETRQLAARQGAAQVPGCTPRSAPPASDASGRM